MRKNEGKLCLQCGQALQANTCKNRKLLWGSKQLPPELEAFTSFAHDAKLSHEKLAELESLLENFGKVTISMRSTQEAVQRGLSFVEPANEQRKRLKSIVEYNRSLVPPRPIIERSLPEVTQAIKRAYQLADVVLRLIGTIRYSKVELSTFRSMLAIPCLREANDEERKQFIEEEERLYQLRSKLADQIDAVGAQLKESGEEMRQASKPLQELLLDILPSEIGTIDLDRGISGWHVFYVLNMHFGYIVPDWAFRHANALRYKVHYGNASRVEEWLQEPFPVSDQDHDKLFKRIRTERSKLLSKLRGYWELHHTEQRSSELPAIALDALRDLFQSKGAEATPSQENGTRKGRTVDLDALYRGLTDEQEEELGIWIDWKKTQETYPKGRTNQKQRYFESRPDLKMKYKTVKDFDRAMDAVARLALVKAARRSLRMLSNLRDKFLANSLADD